MSDLKTSASGVATAEGLLSKRLKIFALFTGALTLGFAWPLVDLVQYAWQSDLHSHALLIPFVSLYLVWICRGEALPGPSSSPALAVVPLALGVAALGALWSADGEPFPLQPNDRLALSTSGYLCFLWAGAFLIFGGELLKKFAFPAIFLVFLVPMPVAVENAVEIFFQHASADAAAGLFTLTGSTVFRDGLVFRLPGIVIQVAQECSGIRSTLVLFITSLLAGNLFLKSPWRRVLFTLLVIPLAILRNGFRVFTIGMLCVHVSPKMIDSPVHHRGGPLFFLLSLIPFFLILVWFCRHERRQARRQQPSADAGLGAVSAKG